MKRLLEYGFWIGVFVACVPLVMFIYGRSRQWQLHQQWDTAQAAVASSDSSSSGTSASGNNGDNGLVRLRIPKLNVDALVVGDITKAALAEGPGHFPSTAMPGEEGNCAIAAHRNVWGEWFRDLDQLQTGDSVILETMRRHYYYRVTGSEQVSPTDDSVLKSHGHKKELTLITCTLPPTRRIVVHGILDHSTTG